MKILELRFKNLNSLYGEWIIDFSDPEYVSNGIFALTGPTGAGKSTILDAICLALYGATPRLGKITSSGNEIMSRQTGECSAEVVFESQAGRFRCRWDQRRSRKKADGKLQSQEHQISDAKTGKLIETKKSLVSGVIEEKTGMDFDRFTRSILLAQGGFDTFLKANPEQKSKILEQITGTDIYSKISIRVHERHRDEKDKLSLLEAETSGIVILGPDEEKEIELNLATSQEQETVLTDKFKETSGAIQWIKTVEALEKEISNLADETEKLNKDTEAFKPERERLEGAIRAASLDGLYSTLVAQRKQQLQDQTDLETKEKALPDLIDSANEQANRVKTAEQQTVRDKNNHSAASPIIQQIRTLDQKLAEQKKTQEDGETNYSKDAKIIEAHKKTLIEEQRKLAQAEKDMEKARSYLKIHARDEWLISGLAGVKIQLDSLLSKQKDIAQKETQLKRAEKTLNLAEKAVEASQKQSGKHQVELDTATKKLELGKKALSKLLDGRLLREYRTQKETLLREMAFLEKIAKLKDQRAKLEDGKPCPLCGSQEHPYAEGNVPVPHETEIKISDITSLIEKVEQLEKKNKGLEKAEARAENQLKETKNNEALADNNKKTAEEALFEISGDLEKLQTSFNQLKQAVRENLQPLGITEIPDEDVSLLLESLHTRLKAWNEQVKNERDIKDQISGFTSEMERLKAVIETRENALKEKREDLDRLKMEYINGMDARKELFGDKKPDEEEIRLNIAIRDAEALEKKTRERHATLQKKLDTAKSLMESLKESMEKREPELRRLEAELNSALIPAGFRDEKLFLEARLSAEIREGLMARAKSLDNQQTNLKARQNDRETRLAAEKEKKVTNKSYEELEPELKEVEDALKQLRDNITTLKNKLSDNNAARERVKEKQATIEAQRKECDRWRLLHDYIGSSDGKKYRNFAQGLTFELMVSHANRQLSKMTDRYLLIRDKEEPLELNVVDNYQAGEIRSTRNLSGGESFIVSLTLALGLSSMASRKVRVDSLFLDEGFGTLDEEALETSLETLSSLQQDGKLIGVISHVSALKERIGTQITITPTSGGHSVLSGPGCTRG